MLKNKLCARTQGTDVVSALASYEQSIQQELGVASFSEIGTWPSLAAALADYGNQDMAELVLEVLNTGKAAVPEAEARVMQLVAMVLRQQQVDSSGVCGSWPQSGRGVG